MWSSPDEYVEEAAYYKARLLEACRLTPRTLLELGSGGGNNAVHMKAGLEMTLVDLSAEMLDVSRRLNPDCEHVQGDMRSVRLGRQFDLVFVHDAVCYMVDEDELRRAVTTAFVHVAPGGAALFAPDYLRETFAPSTDWGGRDDPETGRGLRVLEWVTDPDPDDSTYAADYAVLFREPDGTMALEYERHVEGLFSRATWLRVLGEVGFDARTVVFDHSELEPGRYELFVCTRPAR